MTLLCFNGNFIPADTPILTAQNRSFKWGDGLFETIKVFRGRILLEPFHFERLFTGLRLLGIDRPPDFTAQSLAAAILTLCRKNDQELLSRVRLAVYRDEDNRAAFVIETEPLREEVNRWNGEGLTIDLYPFARKSTDAFSNIKSANFLPYVLAAGYAAERGLGDAIVLNMANAICDTSRANIFMVRKGEFYTPPLSGGCVAGVMRRFLIEALHRDGYAVHQQALYEEDLLMADEVFLTNAIQGMRWVQGFREKEYGCDLSSAVYHDILSTI